ncbi:hypothetical protein EYF80_056783 [Liparis tanakae]|uniref:Uncharacterized protein n=1 Tax=Liparis tanakae TaxID=230148 RepID=A0A4Z2EW83_9TELE|nr:hypothetical protein EYF80_056783 [Liparis tanakae]
MRSTSHRDPDSSRDQPPLHGVWLIGSQCEQDLISQRTDLTDGGRVAGAVVSVATSTPVLAGRTVIHIKGVYTASLSTGWISFGFITFKEEKKNFRRR